MRRETYQSRIGLRLQATLRDMLWEASGKAKQSPAAYARQAVMERLQREGMLTETGADPDRSTALKAA